MKMNKWRYIPFHEYSGYLNMAIDELLLDQVINNQKPNTLRFYKWNPSTATIGAHQSINAEVDLNFAKDNKIQVVRRITGGGAVLHDHVSEITYSIICKISDIPKQLNTSRIYSADIPTRYHPILESLATGLELIGIPIDIGKIHCPALFIEGMKISGNAQLIRNGVLLQHGTILLDVNPDFMYRVLKAPEGVSYTRMVQSVRSKVTGIKKYILSKNGDISDVEITEKLKKGFANVFNADFVSESLSSVDFQKINDLAINKYSSDKWLLKYE